MKVLVVFGTRPEAIKLSPVIHELNRRSVDTGVQTVVCVTAQHRQMLDQALTLFGIKPDYDLNVMDENQSPNQVAAEVLSNLGSIVQREKPDWMLLQGDTTTVAAASLVAFYSQVKLGHVEAGLRTHNKWQPFPEEINRRVAGVMADLHFAPTEQAYRNLLREGVPSEHILVTGNPGIDALYWIAEKPFVFDTLNLKYNGEKLILVTAHRRENFGKPLQNICLALRNLAERYKGHVHIVYPVHLNPNVWRPVHQLLGNFQNITLVEPLNYVSLVHLMMRSCLVLTDSGGIQEEAPSLGKPVLVLREVTERPEAVAAGTVRLVGTDRKRIVDEAIKLLENPGEYERMAHAVNPYGDGLASSRIVAGLLGEQIEPFLPSEITQKAHQI